uniref:Uncharacterized protein n=1 Tax=Oryza brachyantha TaxID=4533 RepID=J3M0A2_ORYBR
MLVSWEIWKKRHNRVFKREEATMQGPVNCITEEILFWCTCVIMPLKNHARLAGAKDDNASTNATTII